MDLINSLLRNVVRKSFELNKKSNLCNLSHEVAWEEDGLNGKVI